MRIQIDGSCLSSHADGGLIAAPTRSIDVRDIGLPKGGQGQVLEVTAIDGRQAGGLLVKLFAEGFPDPLKEIITTIKAVSSEVARQKALVGLPLHLFEGELAGKAVQGYVMRRVGGRMFHLILEEDLLAYFDSDLEVRLGLARQFVDGMAMLFQLTIVHADINGQNLLVDIGSRSLAIIDVDGGAVAKNGRAPVAIKWEPGWLAPEIIRQLAKTKTVGRLNVDIRADLWSTAAGVHYLLFGVAPYFFLAENTDIPRYLRSHAWPTLRQLGSLQTQNQVFFDRYEAEFRRVPALQPLFRTSFQKGFAEPSQRLSAYQWRQALTAALGDVAAHPRARPIAPKPRPAAKPVPIPPPQWVPRPTPPVTTPPAAVRAKVPGAVRALLAIGALVLALVVLQNLNNAPAAVVPTPPGLTLLQLLQRNPDSPDLWSRVVNEWQQTTDRRHDVAVMLGADGISRLLRGGPSTTNAEELVAALDLVAGLSPDFFAKLSRSAQSVGDHAAASAIAEAGFHRWPSDSTLKSLRASLGPPSQPIEDLLRQNPTDADLWDRAASDWQTVMGSKNQNIVLGAKGISKLLRGGSAPVDGQAVSDTLDFLGGTSIDFVLRLEGSAEAAGDRATALSIIEDGLRHWPTESMLLAKRTSLTAPQDPPPPITDPPRKPPEDLDRLRTAARASQEMRSLALSVQSGWTEASKIMDAGDKLAYFNAGEVLRTAMKNLTDFERTYGAYGDLPSLKEETTKRLGALIKSCEGTNAGLAAGGYALVECPKPFVR